MRNAIIGAAAGLLVGGIAAFGLTYHPDDGKLAKAQADLDAANASLAKLTKDNAALSDRVKILSDQNEQLSSGKGGDKEGDATAAAPTAAPAAPSLTTLNPMMIAAAMRGMGGRGGNSQQRVLLLKTRLNLTPDQEKALQTAMETEQRQRMEAMRQRFQNGQGANGAQGAAQPAAPVQTLDQALTAILTPAQLITYQQVQKDEQTSQANTAATVQVNQMSPLLQLSDSQKTQMMAALQQVQLQAPSPASLMGNPDAANIIAAQSKATTDAVSKILTPDQMALYQQQAQAMTAGGGNGFGGNGGPGGGRRNGQGGGRNGGGNGGGGGANQAAAPAGGQTN